jgi:hypothetical protein
MALSAPNCLNGAGIARSASGKVAECGIPATLGDNRSDCGEIRCPTRERSATLGSG